MKIVLINTSFKDIYGYERMFPLGLGYIAAVLLQNEYDILLLEPQLNGLFGNRLKDLIIGEKADLIGITAVTPTFPEAVKIARLIKTVASNKKIVLGGVHASCFPEQILIEYPDFDFVIVGEGEYTMLELCNQLMRERTDYKDISGLCFRKNGTVVKTNPRDYIMDLDSLPMPDRNLVDLRKYRLPLHIDKSKISASMITSRGCPAKCIFCSSKITMGHIFRAHSPLYVVNEIEELVLKHNVKHIQFVDDTFTISAERVRKICQEIIRKDIKFEWHCFARVETVSEDLCLLMKKAGCSTILFGIESGDEFIHQNIKKGINLKKAKEAHGICRKLGINVLSSFIIGNPGETRQTVKKTITFAKELKPTFALFYRLVPYPGTQVYEKYINEGRMKQDLSWENFAPKGLDTVFDHENLSQKELDLFIYRAYKEFYVNPLRLCRILVSIKTFGQLKVLFIGMCSLIKQMLKWRR